MENFVLLLKDLEIANNRSKSPTMDLNENCFKMCSDEEPTSSAVAATANSRRSLRLRSRSHDVPLATYSPIKYSAKVVSAKKLTKPSDVRKMYENAKKKMGRFTATKLQTIFEEPVMLDESKIDSVSFQPVIGKSKVSRLLKPNDGLHITKTLRSKRLGKVKRTFGKKTLFKKITQKEFLDRLFLSFSKSENEPSDEEEDHKGNDDEQLEIAIETQVQQNMSIASCTAFDLFAPTQKGEDATEADIEQMETM